MHGFENLRRKWGEPMPTVKFTNNLKRFFPGLRTVMVQGNTVAEIVVAINEVFPGISDYIQDERGSVRQHVNIFIGEDLINDRVSLSDPVREDDQVYIMQALSGG